MGISRAFVYPPTGTLVAPRASATSSLPISRLPRRPTRVSVARRSLDALSDWTTHNPGITMAVDAVDEGVAEVSVDAAVDSVDVVVVVVDSVDAEVVVLVDVEEVG